MSKNPTSRRRGFTLIELLTVIGIIVVLIGILLPVANSIVKKARETDTRAQLARLATSIQNYYQNYNSYPGPIAETEIYGYNSTVPNPVKSCGASLTNCTGAENLVLGLIGGLRPATTWTSAVPAQYDPLLMATIGGPVSLNPNLAQQTSAFYSPTTIELYKDLTGTFTSWASVANLPAGTPAPPALVVPELMDRFSNPRPIIYLRARIGATTAVDVAPGTGGYITGSQYFSYELGPYWIGANKANDPGTVANASFPSPFPSPADHSLAPVPNTNNPIQYPSFYNVPIDFFKNPSATDLVTARSQNSFILISAGADGIFGTKDDIIYSN